MAKFTIDQLRSLPDYQQLTKWNMRFLTLPVVGAFAIPASEMLDIRCESSEVPKRTNQKIEVDVRGHKVIMPGITTYTNSITLTFTETVDNTMKNFIKAWSELIWGTRSGTSFSKSELEGTLQLQMLNNKDQAIYNYVLYGVFIEDFDLGTLDGNSSDIVRPSITFSYDYYTDTPLKV